MSRLSKRVYSMAAAISFGVVLTACRDQTQMAGSTGRIKQSANVAAESVTFEIEPSEASVRPGETAAFQVSMIRNESERTDVTSEATWSVKDTQLAEVIEGQAGKIKGSAAGETVVEASVKGQALSAKLKIEAPPVTEFSLKIKPESEVLAINAVRAFKVFAVHTGGEEIDVTEKAEWSVTTPQFASIGNVSADKGQLKALAAGAGSVSVAYDSKTVSAQFKVEPDPIKRLDPKAQKGLQVRACFSYDKVKIAGHICNRALFDLSFFGVKVGQINLNNGSTGASVEGGKFTSAWNDAGSVTLSTKCSTATCHRDVAFLSIIGDIIDENGNTKWLKIEQGRIEPDKEYTYKFVDFQFVDRPMEFGKLCEIVLK